MKISDYLKYSILLSVFLFISCQTCCPPPIEPGASCDKITERGYINILVINVDALESEHWLERLEHIADFAAEDDVDVILLQEIKGGAAAETDNSADELKKILRNKHNIDYNLSTSWEIGVSGFWRSANAILSRCEIKSVQCEELPFVETRFKRDVDKKMKAISITRNVQMARLEIPERGLINVYNTHLCARCTTDGRTKQLDELLEIFIKMETEMPGNYPSVLGGDFNFDRFVNQGAERFLWQKVIDNGFMDAYAEFFIKDSGDPAILERLCEKKDKPDEHCTKGVTRLDCTNGRRIDYIFAKSPASIKAARVVFNEIVNNDEPTVSDHAGVFISLELP